MYVEDMLSKPNWIQNSGDTSTHPTPRANPNPAPT